MLCRSAVRRWGMVVLVVFAGSPSLWGQQSQPTTAAVELTPCAECHKGPSPSDARLAPELLLAGSSHAGLSCDSCHVSIDMDKLDRESAQPHGPVPPVNCGECHEEETADYIKHGRSKVGEDVDVPACWDCHGHHDILPSSDLRSHVHPVHVPDTCRSCHSDLNLTKRHDNLRQEPIKLYESSVHGTATHKGIYLSATCNDCHSARTKEGKRSAHRILGAADPDSTIHHFSIPDTCGECHKPVTSDFWEGIHGKLVKRGSVDAPVCTNCHGEHGIIRAKDSRSPVNPAHVAQQTCAPCHESAVLNAKYGLTGGRLASYIDSYHGLKSKAGDATVANCASCHGAHRILPSTDPQSSINPGKLRETCGKCHPGITEQLAQLSIHATATGLYTGWPRFFQQFYIVIIVGTIGFMLLHNVADWLRSVRNAYRQPYVQRLSINETMQHWALMISFTVLVVSGFSLRFSDSWWVQILFGWEGGFELRGTIHRGAAVLMIVSAVWHLLYWLGHRGRRWLWDMVASLSDLRDLWHNILFFLGRRDHEPSYGRFNYMEKAEYWAMVWGTIIMTGTGLFLWFDNVAVRFVPKGVLDVLLIIHYYEAWLATLAIFVWHIYGTVFRPKVYPMNPAWLAGRMPKEMYAHEHPAGPKLVARVSRPRHEEEVEPDADPAPRGSGHRGE